MVNYNDLHGFASLNVPEKQDFKLPVEIFKEFYRVVEPSYRKGWSRIKRNVYIDVNEAKNEEPSKCDCTGKGCNDNTCVNRYVYVECHPTYCSKNCKNQRMRNFEYLSSNEYEIKFNKRKGWAVHATIPLIKGEYILEYTGEVISSEHFKHRRSEMANKKNFYFLQFQNKIIDAFNKGSDARFVNHSCNPNCQIEIWTVDNQKRIGLFAIKSIKEGEEITYNYNFMSDESYPCFCGSRCCSGIMGKQKSATLVLFV